MKPEVLEAAKMRMVNLLTEELEILTDPSPNVYGDYYSLPMDHPQIMGRGTTAIVFDLGSTRNNEGETSYICGKVCGYNDQIEGLPEDAFYMLGVASNCSIHRDDHLDATIRSLKRMGIEVPLQKQFALTSSSRCFSVGENLKEGGKYEVKDAIDFPFKILNDGRKLRKEYEATVGKIADGILSQDYELKVNGHMDEGSYMEAVERMFFVQYDPKRRYGSRIVPSDLDHLSLKHKQMERRGIEFIPF